MTANGKVTSSKSPILTIALAKGRIAEKAVELLIKCGIPCGNILEPSRKLELYDDSGKYKFIFVKPSDVPVYIEYGVADVGICGSDTVMEEDKSIYELLDLGFAKCKLCIAGYKKDAERIYGQDVTVATKYVNVAKRLFHERGQNVKIVKLYGSVELGPIVRLSDFILDIVESGKTLAENDLVVLEEICDVSARLVANKVSLKTKTEVIKPLIEKLSKAVG